MRAGMIGMAILLNSCGSVSQDVDGSAGEANRVATANPDPASLRPGAWAAEVSLASVDSPDMAPEALDELKAELTAAYAGHDSCLAPDDVERPPQQFFSGSAEGCRYERLRLAGGEVSGAMTCEPLPTGEAGGLEPATHRIEFRGSYAANSYSLRSEQVTESADQSRRIAFVLTTQARRVGDC